MLNDFLLSTIIFCAGLVTGISGFGLPLLTMPLLSQFLNLHVVLTLVAELRLVSMLVLLSFYRQSFNLKAVMRLAIASLIAVPLGVMASDYINEQLILNLLGVIIVVYVAYCWFAPRLPTIKSPRWAYAAGLSSGLLLGACDVGGPPLLIYANCSQWNQEEFKSNLPAIGIFGIILTVTSHVINQDFTGEVWSLSAMAVPSLIFGLGIGMFLSNYRQTKISQKFILVLLLLMSLMLLV